NQGVRYALSKQYKWVLTLDQDSEFYPNTYNILLAGYENLKDKDMVMLIAPKPVERVLIKDSTMGLNIRNQVEILWKNAVLNLTSGSLIKAEAFSHIGFFEEKLFIEQVDNDFCYRLGKKGYKIKVAVNVPFVHEIGKSLKKMFFLTRNHSEKRKYYLARNVVYVFKKYFSYAPYTATRYFLGGTVLGWFKIFLFEDNKTSKIKSGIRGLMDGLFNKWITMKYKNIVILADAGIGDFIWATSALSLIRDYDKNIKIILVTSSKYVQLIDESLHINEVITTNNKYHVSKNKFIRLFYKFCWSIKNYPKLYNVDACLLLDISSFFTITAKYLYRIKNIIGPDNFSFGYDIKNKTSKYYTKIVKMPKDNDKTAFIMRYQILVRSIFPTYNLSIPKLPDTSNLSNKIIQLIGNTKKYKIALCTQSSVLWRTWNIKYFQKFIEKFDKFTDATYFIVGNSKQEEKNAIYLQNNLKNTDIRNICGKTTLLELKEFFKNIDLLISVDTGAAHIASVLNIPIISLHGASLPENSSPVSYKTIPLCSYRYCSPCTLNTILNNFICKKQKCMDDITPELVFKTAVKILKVDKKYE
ncbi:MAG: glycosyltransferase family 9 protein, partial [Endomicrobiaceae bacterium]